MAIPVLKIPLGSSFIKPGDTIPKISFAFDAGDAIDLTGATIKMQLYLGQIKVFEAETGNGMTLIDGKTFELDQIEAASNDLPEGVLVGDVQVAYASGVVQTLFNVQFTVSKQYTV